MEDFEGEATLLRQSERNDEEEEEVVINKDIFLTDAHV
jgi:hypothetical protein